MYIGKENRSFYLHGGYCDSCHVNVQVIGLLVKCHICQKLSWIGNLMTDDSENLLETVIFSL